MIIATIGPTKYQARPSSPLEASSRAHRAPQPTIPQVQDLAGSQDRGGKATIGAGSGTGTGAGASASASDAAVAGIGTDCESYELDDYEVISNRKDQIAREERRKTKKDEKRQWLDEQDEMKFSHSIQFNAVPDWSSHYIAYSNLKKLLVPPSPISATAMAMKHLYMFNTNTLARIFYLESTNSRRPSTNQAHLMLKQDLCSARRTLTLFSVGR